MAKLTILAATFTVLLVMIANTCAYSITNIEVDGYRDADVQAPVRSTCCEQVQRQDLNQCVQYLKRASEGYLSLRRGCDEKEEQQQQAALLYCEQLRQLDDNCQCEGVVEVFKEQIQQGQLQGQGMREIFQRVRELPEMCDLETQHCEIPSGCGFAF
nr:2S albumin-like [Quercus suber]XP_023876982.1 2S albumin-like [Quercus suber]POE80450.1 2s albumin [Quercus suber]POE88585.1 2s albumin [Quercus suber]